MKRFPLEIENNIWNIYYHSKYKDIVNEINNNLVFFYDFNNEVSIIENKILNMLYKTAYLQIRKHQLVCLNNQLLHAINNKAFYLLFNKDPYINYIYQILKFDSVFPRLPESCKYIGAYLYKKSNFNPKMMKRLIVICSGENIMFLKSRNLTIP